MTFVNTLRYALARRGARLALCAALLLPAAALVLVADATAEQASAPGSPAAAGLNAGGFHSCALVGDTGALRCWGFGADGQLGYGRTDSIGDDETPAAAGPVNIPGRTVRAVATGDAHTCALLDDATVRCWGFGGSGRLGYGNTNNVTDPAAVGAVGLGTDAVTGMPHTALAISAGSAHTCALRDDRNVVCWGFGGTGADGTSSAPDGRLGYGNRNNVGDRPNNTPGLVGAVAVGGPVSAISAGGDHTCALLVDKSVRCWGVGSSGQLGYGNRLTIGDDETPASVLLPVQLGGTAEAITAGGSHSCALLSTGVVRCWGQGGAGQLGYGNRNNIGDDETPVSVAPVSIGGPAVAISAGLGHTCAILATGSVRCWGLGASGRLGYANQNNIGDDEQPDAVGPVDIGGAAAAISAGRSHTCARLRTLAVRCWGLGYSGRLGYCSEAIIGDDEVPGAAGPVNLAAGDGGAACPLPAPAPAAVPPAPDVAVPPAAGPVPPTALPNGDRARARRLRGCLARVARHRRSDNRAARRGSAARRAAARRHATRHARSGRRVCLLVHGRVPARVTGVEAGPAGLTSIVVAFDAVGTNGSHPPVARSYVIAQSRRPIRTARDFNRAQILCKGSCGFRASKIGQRLAVVITELQPRTTYYYAIRARDNVSDRCGPRSRTVSATTGPPPPSDGSVETPPLGDNSAPACRTLP